MSSGTLEARANLAKGLCSKGLHPRAEKGGCCRECTRVTRRSLEARNRENRRLGIPQPPHKSRKAPDWFPVEHVIPIIQEWVDQQEALAGIKKNERGNISQSGERDIERQPYSPMQRLCEEAGISRRTLWGWLNGNCAFVSVEKVDAVFCAMGIAHRLYVEPLAQYYFAGLEVKEEERIAA